MWCKMRVGHHTNSRIDITRGSIPAHARGPLHRGIKAQYQHQGRIQEQNSYHQVLLVVSGCLTTKQSGTSSGLHFNDDFMIIILL